MSASAPEMEAAKARALPSADATTHDRPFISEVGNNVAGYLAAMVVTLAIVAFSLRIWRADLSVPLKYRGDNLVTQMFIQGIRENGWYLENPRLGMPLPQQMHDYPMADTLHFVILKLLNWVFHDDGLALNLYSLLCFPLVALSSYFVLRRFRLARLTALAPSVLYACGPYHFCRLSTHLYLSAYYLLPLMTLLLVRIYLGRLPFVGTDAHGSGSAGALSVGSRPVQCCFATMTGIAGAYYAFFSATGRLPRASRYCFADRK